MSNADKIGLLPGFGWIADQAWFGDSVWSHFLSTLIVCWGLTPFGHVAWAFIAQATVLPLDSERQWRSFFPGDLFLGVGAAITITTAGMAEVEVGHWWQSRAWHTVVLCAALLIAIFMTWLVDAQVMPLTALLSPCKLYHNLLLYGGYGYVVFVSSVAAMLGNGWSVRQLLVIAAIAAVTPWIVFVIQDGQLTREQAIKKQQHSTPASYKLFWLVRVRGQYRR